MPAGAACRIVPVVAQAIAGGRGRCPPRGHTLMAELADSRDARLLEPTADGTRVRPANAEEQAQMAAGLNAAEVLLPKTRVQTADQPGLFP